MQKIKLLCGAHFEDFSVNSQQKWEIWKNPWLSAMVFPAPAFLDQLDHFAVPQVIK